jgi:hypothetical protein
MEGPDFRFSAKLDYWHDVKINIILGSFNFWLLRLCYPYSRASDILCLNDSQKCLGAKPSEHCENVSSYIIDLQHIRFLLNYAPY